MPFRYYEDPVIDYIYPRYGPKDGGTFVEVYGKNFLNFDQNLRCAFGSREVKAFYVSSEYMICYSSKSDVTGKEMPFSVSLNNQQNTKQNVDFVYYEFPQVFRLEPAKGPDTGGTKVFIRGQNFDPTKDIAMSNHNDTFCKFGNLSLSLANVISSTEMECESPPNYELTETMVEISLNNREWTRDEIPFNYYHPPFIFGLEPKVGSVDGGTVVSITGSNFDDTGYVACKFGAIFVKGEYVNENQLRCIAPPVENPGYVNLYVGIRPNEFSSGMNTRFLYYDTPKIHSIEPMCGPESGLTQITIVGENFADTGSDFVKCVFDGTIFTNATVYSHEEIKCDSPSVLNYEGINEKNITEYDVQITLNNKDLSGPMQKFSYYKDTVIRSITPIYGPQSGNTTVNVTGSDFTQAGACNATIRIASYHIKPHIIEKEFMTFKTPEVHFTGATVVQVALNGRQFDKDIEVHHRNKENTFYYYKQPLIRTINPKKGPTTGGSHIDILGAGFDDIFFNIEDNKNKKVYYKFIDADDKTTQYGETYTTTVTTGNKIKVVTPKVNKDSVRAHIYFSYNNENFNNINEEIIFEFYTLPEIVSFWPLFGPLRKEAGGGELQITLDNYICNSDCDNYVARYRSTNNIFYEKCRYERPNTLNCTLPTVNRPEPFNVEVSADGIDFTNNNKNFTFYDPYILTVKPKMVSSRGGTKLDISGFGFANSGEENLKVLFGSDDIKLRCDLRNCMVTAQYVSELRVQATTYPMDKINDLVSGENIGFGSFPVEVAVHNNDFTNNNVTIFYFDEPEIITDIYSNTLPMELEDKEALGNSIIQNIPANLDTILNIAIDSRRINKYFAQFNQYANYTCKYTMSEAPFTEKITQGSITSFPLKSELNNVFMCQSPQWQESGKGRITISLNGYDYSETGLDMVFTNPIKIHKMEPPCGPREGNTKVRIIGSGFQYTSEYNFKWGVQNIVPMNETKLIKTYKQGELESQKIYSKIELDEIELLSPSAPEKDLTLGGSNYISFTKNSFFPIENGANRYFSSNYISSDFEFFYYHQPFIQSIYPHGSIVNGGAKVIVVGAWFDYQPEYEVKPYCKFGNKIVEGEFLSTVRIACVAPKYDTPNVRVPFEVSLNKQDFTDSGLLFTYYTDFTKAKFDSISPESGPNTGGTNIKVYGESLTNLLNPEEFLCLFEPTEGTMPPKKVPAGFKDFGNNKTAIICNTPGGWSSGTMANIKITFDGQNYIDTGYDFYFYKIDYLNPASGPNSGNGPIQVMGSGFQNSTKVKCILNNIEMKPVDVYPDRILCPMTECSFGKNYTGSVDFGVSLNGIDWKMFPNGFYYYKQPNVTDIFPEHGPSKGKAKIKVFGKGFRNDFKGARPGCKVGNYYGEGHVVDDKTMDCFIPNMPLLERNQTLNMSLALNNYSFTEEHKHLNFTPYGVSSISPSSGPIEGGTRIEVKGAGFFDSKNIRCRFGVPGWYGYTTGKFIDYNKIICPSPLEFTVPEGGKLPFSVPFSIAFNDDEFSKFILFIIFYFLFFLI